jgi:hypothetical protein
MAAKRTNYFAISTKRSLCHPDEGEILTCHFAPHEPQIG